MKRSRHASTTASSAALEHGRSRKPPPSQGFGGGGGGGGGRGKGPADVNVDGRRITDEERSAMAGRRARAAVYARGPRTNTSKKAVGKEQLRASLARYEDRVAEAAELNVGREELLLTQGGGYLEAENGGAGNLERTGKVTQAEVARHVAHGAGREAYALDLPHLGPYGGCDWSRNGRHLLLGGAKGHVALLDATRTHLVCELNLRETVRDACFLHNESLFAVAQRKALYVYDRDGVELHCLRTHVEPTKLAFLPYHFLLAAASKTGFLKYQDVSTGSLVSEHRTRLGGCHVLGLNPQNGVVHLGHHNGTVTLWSPAAPAPLVKLLAHRGPLGALAVDPSGTYMASAGLAGGGGFKVWDLRTYREVHSYYTARPVGALSVSQSGLLGVGFGSHVQVWKDWAQAKAKSPYMRHELPGSGGVGALAFRPFEDVLGVGHAGGYQSLVVPGAGEANYDALEANPFESRKERREAEVHQLLDKLPPETIALDEGFVGAVDAKPEQLREERKALHAEEDAARRAAMQAGGGGGGGVGGDGEPRERKRMKGRSKIGAKLRRKRKNIIDNERVQLQARLDKEKKERAAAAKAAKDGRQAAAEDAGHAPPPAALNRFFGK